MLHGQRRQTLLRVIQHRATLTITHVELIPVISRTVEVLLGVNFLSMTTIFSISKAHHHILLLVTVVDFI